VGGFDTRFMFKYGHSVSARRGLAAQHAITGKLEKNYTRPGGIGIYDVIICVQLFCPTQQVEESNHLVSAGIAFCVCLRRNSAASDVD
jgi:hypothetical protein